MDKNFTYIKDRMLYVVECKGDVKEKFYKKLGVSPPNFRGTAKEGGINSKYLEKFLTIYPDVNPYWLLTGLEEPFITSGDLVEERKENYSTKKSKHLNKDEKYIHDLFDKFFDEKLEWLFNCLRKNP